MYVLDTNSLIFFFRGEGNIGNRVLETPSNQIAIPSVVVFEIEYGIAKSKRSQELKRGLDSFLQCVHVIDFDQVAAIESAGIRANLEKSGTPIGPYDVLIAGIAISANGILVTRNMRE